MRKSSSSRCYCSGKSEKLAQTNSTSEAISNSQTAKNEVEKQKCGRKTEKIQPHLTLKAAVAAAIARAKAKTCTSK